MDRRRILLGLVAHGLPATPSGLPDRPLPDEEWGGLRSAVRHQRLTGQAVAAADAGALPVTEDQRARITTSPGLSWSSCRGSMPLR